MKDKKKMQARMDMLRAMSKKKGSELHEPTLGKKLAEKKFSKVSKEPEVDEDEKGLTKAQLILKSKLGDLFDKEDEEEEYEDCEECDGEGCPACEEEEESEDESAE